ncbi:Swr1 complex histone demethylase subunit Msc1 [Schizosaccharomyces osmophilus]|uniref:Swr1 complex histone demethylase subunit Msc1 n=1 Tax=Schizosaccharomyces osmophilus TaxID=2545709 RepID=A0AAE9W7E2_9SCHI|nr:Swr1 complex histone demethylase subunit Msc1 [Schizosaccharomyces osmophilus]WBW70869.1 Swr1 complex histone demethylase subunit Msc1 [Schizosaccharomyces osmophilus]
MRKSSLNNFATSQNLFQFPSVDFEHITESAIENSTSSIHSAPTEPISIGQEQKNGLSFESKPISLPSKPSVCKNLLTNGTLQFSQEPSEESFALGLAYISELYTSTKHLGASKILPPPGWSCPFTIDPTTLKFICKDNSPSTRSVLTTILSKDKDKDKELPPTASLSDEKRIADRSDSVVLSYIFVLGKQIDLLQLKQWLQISKKLDMPKYEFWSQAAQFYKLDVNSLETAYSTYESSDSQNVTNGTGFSSSPITRPVKRARRQLQGPKCKVCDQEGSSFVSCYICQSSYHYSCLEAPFAPFADIHYFTCNRCIPDNLKLSWKDVDYHCISSFLDSNYQLESSLSSSISSFRDEFSPLCIHNLNNCIPSSKSKAPERKTRSSKTNDDSSSSFPFGLLNPESHYTYLSRLSPLEQYFWSSSFYLNSSRFETSEQPLIGFCKNKTAFPTNRQSPYYNDPWNLPFLQFAKLSPLKFTPPEILTPTLQFGQMMSCSGWKKNTMSLFGLHYHHSGSPKTWYVIPAEETAKYEKLLFELLPLSLKDQPETIKNSSFLLPLQVILANGINVNTFLQYPNEFVITFPDTIYTSLDHGFNIHEFIPFAAKEWITDKYAQQSFQAYKELCIPTPFSYDHILLANATVDKTVHSAYWLMTCFKERIDTELKLRNNFRKKYASLPWVPIPLESSVMACSHCKTFAYLAAVGINKSAQTFCLLHAGQNLNMKNNDLAISVRYNDEALLEAYDAVVGRAKKAEAWLEKYREAFSNSRPSLKVLKALYNEADTLSCPIQEVEELRSFVHMGQNWLEKASVILKRKAPVKKDKRKMKRNVNESPLDEGISSPTFKYNESEILVELVEEGGKFPFEIQELELLNEKLNLLKSYQSKAKSLMNQQLTYDICLNMVNEGKELQMETPELESFEKQLSFTTWTKNYKEVVNREDFTLQELVDLINRGNEIGIPSDSEEMAQASFIKDKSERWNKQVETFLIQEATPTQKLVELKNEAKQLCVDKILSDRLNEVLFKSVSSHDRLVSLIAGSENAEFEKRPTVDEARNVLSEAEALTSKPDEFLIVQKLVTKTLEWVRKGKRLFGKANAPLEIFNQHLELVDQKDSSAMIDEGSDAHLYVGNEYYIVAGNNPLDFHYCFCRLPESGMMIECEVCHEWYHAKCMKMSKKKLRANEKFVCPVCDYRVEIPRHSHRPPLIELQQMVSDIPSLPFRPAEVDLLKRVVNEAVTFRDRIQNTIQDPSRLSFEDIPIIRFFLRKLEGVEILYTEEINVFRQKLHELLPIAPLPPPFIGESRSNRKPRPTKRQREIMDQVESGKLTSAEGAAAIAATQIRNQTNSVTRLQNVHTLSTTLSPWAMKSLAEAVLSPAPLPTADTLVNEPKLTHPPDAISPDITKITDFNLIDNTEAPVTSTSITDDQDSTAVCLCKQPFAISDGMVQCHTCSEWYHYDCVGLSSEIVSTLSTYTCPECCSKQGKLYPFITRPRSIPSLWASQTYPPSVLQGTTENFATLNKAFTTSANLFDMLTPMDTTSYSSKVDYFVEDKKPDLFTETYLSM